MRVPVEWRGRGSSLQYRIYFLDGAGRISAPPHQFEADGDETAVKLAEAWREGRRIELWCRERRVECWDSSSS